MVTLRFTSYKYDSLFNVFDVTIYVFLCCVPIEKLLSLKLFLILLSSILAYHHITILKYSIYLPLPVCFICSYVFMLLISILSLQLEELLSTFLVRQV